jgi:hypothetical protein
MAVTHAAVVVVPDDGTSPVGTDEWNASHTVADASFTPAKVIGTAVVTADSRLSDARTPTAHASTHQASGSDIVTPTWISVHRWGL